LIDLLLNLHNYFQNIPNMPQYSQKERDMIDYGLDDCKHFDGMSVPPVCPVKPILDRQCLPCRRASNRASAIFSREHREAQHVIQGQKHNHLQAVLQYYKSKHQIQEIENNAMRAAIAAKAQEKDELISRHELRLQQEWERRD
jgi:hypothetical protein